MIYYACICTIIEIEVILKKYSSNTCSVHEVIRPCQKKIKSTNWFEANNYCSFTGGRLANPDDMNQNSCTNKSMDIWLGKYDQERLTPWIAKLGCYLITDRGKLYATPSLLDCYRSCQSTSFGYKKPWCSCEEDAIVDNAPDAACVFEIRNFLWIYNNTETQGSSIFSDDKDSQDNGEKICNENSDHLITKQMCSSFDMDDRITPEILDWDTTISIQYHIPDRCPSESGLKLVEYIENCERQLDGFVCTFHGHSENYITVKPSPESSLALAVIRSYEPSYLSFGYESTNVPLQSIAVTSLFTKTSVSLYAQQKTASSILPTSVTLQLISDHARIHVVSASVDTSAESAITNIIDMSNTVYSSVVTEQNIKQVTDNNGRYRKTVEIHKRSHLLNTYMNCQHLNSRHCHESQIKYQSKYLLAMFERVAALGL
ncbi:unnamed protein product [Mytilus coruscus]|uniref:C-type lectin domain-containing protein n=1 Tax=Mytilus coruscus TaxID=42192 RepID=A0A6J8CHU0_MYTCO|nr:unnamed protein product [Mytilus coruscus]